MELKTSKDFQSGYDAAAKASRLIMDAQEAEIAKLHAALLPYAEETIESEDRGETARKALTEQKD